MFNLQADLDRLRKTIEIGDVVLLAIDPVSAYMGGAGKIDSFRTNRDGSNARGGRKQITPGARDEAKTFLRDLLADGKPIPQTEIEELAKAEGIAKRTLVRAKKELSIKSVRADGKWTWAKNANAP